jgi:tryptophan 2,3-dioxygenase
MLFVIIHQTKELWLKQILHEVALAQSLVRAGDLVPAYKSLARVSRIQAVMTMSWDILATMTPADYLRFRGVLGSSSGFQSDQFRRFEAMLGLKDERFLASTRTGPRPTPRSSGRLKRPASMTTPWPNWPPPACRCPAEVAEPRRQPALRALRRRRGRLAGGLSRHRPLVALLPAGREAGRSGRRPADLAAQACRHRRTDHRPAPRHRRHRGRRPI